MRKLRKNLDLEFCVVEIVISNLISCVEAELIIRCAYHDGSMEVT